MQLVIDGHTFRLLLRRAPVPIRMKRRPQEQQLQYSIQQQCDDGEASHYIKPWRPSIDEDPKVRTGVRPVVKNPHRYGVLSGSLKDMRDAIAPRLKPLRFISK